jgi:hypothetical protein
MSEPLQEFGGVAAFELDEAFIDLSAQVFLVHVST